MRKNICGVSAQAVTMKQLQRTLGGNLPTADVDCSEVRCPLSRLCAASACLFL
jgi:hypothetical protein